MRAKIYNVLNKIYGITMTASFFAGFLPLIPFIIAIIIGGGNGGIGESISLFLQNVYYPVVIAAASISVLIGITAHCIGNGEKKNKKSE